MNQNIIDHFGIVLGTVLLYSDETFDKIEEHMKHPLIVKNEKMLVISIASNCYKESYLFRYLKDEKIKHFKMDFESWKELLGYAENSEDITNIILSKMYDEAKTFHQFEELQNIAALLGFVNIANAAKSSKEVKLEHLSEYIHDQSVRGPLSISDALELILENTADHSSLRMVTIARLRLILRSK
ncbi:MAG: hypothetical protein WCW78_03235 [Candidatus Paceibacterota bacterium]